MVYILYIYVLFSAYCSFLICLDQDGRAASAVLVSAMFCFCHLFNNPVSAIQLLNAKRPGIGLWPSHRRWGYLQEMGIKQLNTNQAVKLFFYDFVFRYIAYICDLVSDKPAQPHCKPIVIKSATISPMPCFNKQRNGCRPFCEVLIGETRIFSTMQDYERMKWVTVYSVSGFLDHFGFIYSLMGGGGAVAHQRLRQSPYSVKLHITPSYRLFTRKRLLIRESRAAI